MANNYNVNILNRHKHKLRDEVDEWKPADLVLCIRKRVDHWLNSLHRNPATFPQMRPAFWSDGEINAAPTAFYALFYADWENQPGVQCLDYAALLADPERVLDNIAVAAGIQRINAPWNENGPQWDKMNDAKRDFYLERGIWEPRTHC